MLRFPGPYGIGIFPAHGLGVIGTGADGDEHALTVRGKDYVAGAVSAVAIGKARHNDLGGSGRLKIAVLIGESNDGVIVGYVNPLGMISRRIECDAEGAVEIRGENLVVRGSVGSICGTQDANAVGGGFRDENVPIGGDTNDAGI
jgi:hypothetical protein